MCHSHHIKPHCKPNLSSYTRYLELVELKLKLHSATDEWPCWLGGATRQVRTTEAVCDPATTDPDNLMKFQMAVCCNKNSMVGNYVPSHGIAIRGASSLEIGAVKE